MSRIQNLASRPKRTLGALAVVLAAVGITVGSGANFTATSQSPNTSVFATGVLSVDNASGSPVLNTGPMAPGDTKSGTLLVSNSGTVPGYFNVKQTLSDPSSPLASAMRLTILDCGDVPDDVAPHCVTGAKTVYDGSVSTGTLGNFTPQFALNIAGASTQKWAAKEKHLFKFVVDLPNKSSANDDPLQGKTVSATYDWTATT